MRSAAIVLLVIVTGPGWLLAAQRQSQPAARPASRVKTTTDAACAADLGMGVKSGRQFCDVVVAQGQAGSVTMAIPAHTGTATLLFDLHPRFEVPVGDAVAMRTFARHTALVAIVQPTGAVIDRAIVVREFRTADDLFDRIAGTGSGGVKVVAPGQPEAVRITIPAGVASVGIVGLRLDVMTRAVTGAFDAPGRPVAIVSNLRIEYTPR
jgi:hypothetical protein